MQDLTTGSPAADPAQPLRRDVRFLTSLLGEVLRSPAFPEREVERLKGERLAELLQLRAEPRGLADEMFERFLYEPASRYSRPEGGTEESVQAITRVDIRRFYETRYRASSVTLILVGDVDADEAEKMATTAFDDWLPLFDRMLDELLARLGLARRRS